MVIDESSTRDEILNIILLRGIDAIRCGRDLQTKEAMKGT